MRKVLWLCTAVAVSLLAVFGAASSRSPRPPRVITAIPVRALIRSYGGTGGLVGAIVFTGNVPRGARKNRYHRGWVEVGQHGHLVSKKWVKTGHKYHFALTPGSYDIAGYTRWGPPCRGSVQIRPDRTTHQNVYCDWH
jgi:hypothetical protein